MKLITVKKDVRGFCQPGVLISLLKAFPPAPIIRMLWWCKGIKGMIGWRRRDGEGEERLTWIFSPCRRTSSCSSCDGCCCPAKSWLLQKKKLYLKVRPDIRIKMMMSRRMIGSPCTAASSSESLPGCLWSHRPACTSVSLRSHHRDWLSVLEVSWTAMR